VIGLLQRVDGASVEVDGREIARIGRGLLVLVGVERGDDDRSPTGCSSGSRATVCSATRRAG
jgi:D-Tyr-tRNAtyr deacylase